MSLFKVYATAITRYEITVDADSEARAGDLAREAVVEGVRPSGLIDFWDNEEPLEMDISEWRDRSTG